MVYAESLHHALVQLCKQYAQARPFVCEGLPYDQQVMLVGYNPATLMDTPFLEFWNSHRGFDRRAWQAHYQHERQGKTGLSKTRALINRLNQHYSSYGVLETNLYAHPSASKKQLQHQNRYTDFLQLLLNSYTPRVMVVYSADARRFVESFYYVDLQEGRWKKHTVNGQVISIFAAKHFSRGWSFDGIDQLGQTIRTILDHA
jgi:hypothetical protein